MKEVKNRFVKQTVFILAIFFILSVNLSCEKEDTPSVPTKVNQTLLMYLPWSDNLYTYFQTNISDMEKAIGKGILKQERVIVFLSTSVKEATMFELTYQNGKIQRKTLKNYTNLPYTTAEGITSLLNDIKNIAPANQYAMTIGCHGMGWIPVSKSKVRSISPVKMHWEYEDAPLTRYFGGTTSATQTDITTLAKGIADAGLKMEYIMFDDCYMSTVEVAYDLKHVTDHLIGSTSEIMAYGMPYEKIGKYLLGNVDYEAICNEFYSFYSTFDMPCGTIAVTDCSELDQLAGIMKKINQRYTFNTEQLNSIQPLDGYSPVIFFDYGDYISKLCDDPELSEQLNIQLNKTIPFKRNTEYYYSAGKGKIKINTFSGITISDPSQNQLALKKTETNWYKATH